MNRLGNEKSPYLLQHAHNPVDWYPWGAEAFEKALLEDKPIFLSVGYSTCHWCHVMERESFENEALAGLLNRWFVPIKVDREERPDVDRIYMTFVQATTGGGGWPMSVWLTPDLKPFFGGTYFPPDSRWGRPGFGTVIERIAEAWREDHDRIVEAGRDALDQLRKHVEPAAGGGSRTVDAGALESAFNLFRRGFDARHGGFGGAPKFPRPSVYNFLLRYWARTRNGDALEMVLGTLRSMAAGGMCDHLGGGFHRYSVDERWRVPHFEKMLYDQAQLAVSYLEAFQITGGAEYAEAARHILDYVLRDLRDPEGGFYSAEDADSPDPDRPETRREGAFYVWSRAEIEADWFAYAYGVEDAGNVADDPHGEFSGRNILYRAHTVEETAHRFERGTGEVAAALAETRLRLLEARGRRPRPHRDDKVLAAWNGLMISALALGGATLDEPAYTEAAARAAAFIETRMIDPASGGLLRRWRMGDAAIPGFLDDYAFFVQALLDLYETAFDLHYLQLAMALTEKQRELFEDRASGGFYSTAAGDPSLVLRIKEDYDGAEPSGNSVAVLNLLRLARMIGRADFRASAEAALAAFAPRVLGGPEALPQMLAAWELALAPPREVVLVGDKTAADTQQMLRTLHARFLPGRVVLLVDGEEARRTLAAWLPEIRAMHAINGHTAAYVCENYACQTPVSSAENLAGLLQ